MPQMTVRIESEKMPPLEAARKVENMKDLRRLFKDADAQISKVSKMFPEFANAKVRRVSMR